MPYNTGTKPVSLKVNRLCSKNYAGFRCIGLAHT